MLVTVNIPQKVNLDAGTVKACARAYLLRFIGLSEHCCYGLREFHGRWHVLKFVDHGSNRGDIEDVHVREATAVDHTVFAMLTHIKEREG